MEVRIFRGAIRPPTWLGMPYVFGVSWVLLTLGSLMIDLMLTVDHPKVMLISLMVLALVSITVFLFARTMTAKDPFRLRQWQLRLMFRLEQQNFSKRREFVFVPYKPRRRT